jgi:CheY-like chemotaxis protein
MTAEHGPRALLAEDVDTGRNLPDLGYRVDTAHDGPSAPEIVRPRPDDVALLDMTIPGMDGLEPYRQIPRLGAGTVALLLTAYASGATAEEVPKAGAWQVLPIPVDFPRLLGLVGEALRPPMVLVVDDDRGVCAKLWDLFRERGYGVALASTANAAGPVGYADYRVVLTEMRMPDGDGGEGFRVVRDANPRARTLLVSGSRSETDDRVARVLAEGADAVCHKPLDVPGLLDKMRRLAGPDGGAPGEGPGGTPR